jgi:hypothetical protein
MTNHPKFTESRDSAARSVGYEGARESRRMFVAYHGTSPENAALILRDGFKAWTYFAFKPEHAFLHGGPVVFAVQFQDGAWRGEEDGWQFMTRDHIPAERIKTADAN